MKWNIELLDEETKNEIINYFTNERGIFSTPCIMCKFFDFNMPWLSSGGFCKRHAPSNEENGEAVWSHVEVKDWCGDFEKCWEAEFEDLVSYGEHLIHRVTKYYHSF